ncbi:MAG: hypothetical protein PVJ67_04665 [Candidatus Pacearchaeota archaeon]|jgi:hypothetical protein
MKKIIAIGGAVIKTGAGEELKKRINKIEMVMFNGGALFHDFQLALENYTSVPISELIHSTEKLEYTSKYFWEYLKGNKPAPVGSFARLCEDNNISVLLFTALGCDYWQMFDDNWEVIAKRCKQDFEKLKKRFREKTFHYINMGSAVIHPEVFLKAITGINHKFRADVVDFLDMYRPRTRVAVYGRYYKMDFKKYLKEEFD